MCHAVLGLKGFEGMDYGWVNVGFLLSGGNFSIPKPNLLF
jgi:hypothetical protein